MSADAAAGVGVRAGDAAGNDRLTIVTGAHADAWHSASLGSSFSQTTGAFNPRLSVAYRFGESGVAVRGGVAGGFRAPTLNELYRQTQRGNDVTMANEALTPEQLKMADAGSRLEPRPRRRVASPDSGACSTTP